MFFFAARVVMDKYRLMENETTSEPYRSELANMCSGICLVDDQCTVATLSQIPLPDYPPNVKFVCSRYNATLQDSSIPLPPWPFYLKAYKKQYGRAGNNTLL